MNKIFWFDIETTGLEIDKHEIIELSCIVDYDKEEVDRQTFFLRPTNFNTISKESLEITGMSIDRLKGYPEQSKAFSDLVKFLDKHINKYDKNDKFMMGGYNIITFDIPWLERLFEKNNHSYMYSYFNGLVIDVYRLIPILEYITSDYYFPNRKLISSCLAMGIKFEESKLHMGSYDVYLTKELFERIIGRITRR